MQPPPLAVIGAGLIGARHATLIRGSRCAQLVALCDPDPAREAVAAEFGVPLYRDPEALLDRERPAGVVVATPNATHADVAVACLRRGLPVLVEKPVADTLEGARRIAAAAQQHGAPVLVGHHRRHNPLLQRARGLLHGGGLGTLVGVNALWTLRKPEDYFTTAWRRERPGGGPLLINLIHDLDSLRFLCGEVTQVYAQTNSAVRGFAVEDSLALTLTFESGALGTILASDATPAPWSYELTTGENPFYPQVAQDCYHFLGSAASLAFPSLRLWRYPEGVPPGWGETLSCEQLAVTPADPLVRQLEHFCGVIRAEEAPLVSAADAARSLALALAAGRSAESGLPETPETLAQ